MQADVLLHPYRGSDRVVLGRAELGGGYPSLGEALARREQLRRAQQAADVVGAEGGVVRDTTAVTCAERA